MPKGENGDGEALSIDSFLTHLCPGVWKDEAPVWPPDLFAAVASVLQKSGAYPALVRRWPPDEQQPDEWTKAARKDGLDWRNHWDTRGCPPRVKEWWSLLRLCRALQVGRLCLQEHENLCNALLQLCAVADEACVGVGIPVSEGRQPDAFMKTAAAELETDSTLCKNVHASQLYVLPKQHTPQSGITMRSLTHHLALCASSDVRPRWRNLTHRRHSDSLNLLLVPWPMSIAPVQFQPTKGRLLNMPPGFGFFAYNSRSDIQAFRARLEVLCADARNKVGRLDAVLFPELAVTGPEYDVCVEVLKECLPDAFLIAGVGQAPTGSGAGKNYVKFSMQLADRISTSFEQHKHHRWKLDRSQISQYGLGGTLDPNKRWWEYVDLDRPRELSFVAMRPWLTMCVLICEDLARQDPVSETVRAVGPNLVVALLMDSPQLSHRWPARYATVLADDPGSSVLTLTSAGMARLSRPLSGESRPDVVALWKDAKYGGPVEIEMRGDARGVVLCITNEDIEEWTADGRSDGKTSGYPTLAGVHAV